MNTLVPNRPAEPRTPQTPLKVTQRRVIASEWTKFRTLRSNSWTLLIAATLTIGVGAMLSAVVAGQYDTMKAADQASFNATDTSLSGILFSQLAIGILGVLLIAAEYNTGMIRSTLTVTPRRLPMLWAKLGVFTAVIFPLTLVTGLVAFLLGQAFMGSHHLDVTLSAPGALGKILGAALYVTVSGMIGIALGALLRNTAAGISSFVGVFLILPLIAQALPRSIRDHFVQYLPSNAGSAMFGGADGVTNALTPLTGFLALTAVAAILIGVAGWQLKTRDV